MPEFIDLYEKRKTIHPEKSYGLFNNISVITLWLMLLWFFLAPWLTWFDRQAILFDLYNRQFFIFGITFWPQDLVLLWWFLCVIVVTVCVSTVIAGRLWCGFICPQTILIKIFLKIERFIEGSRNKRFKLDKSPWNLKKILKKGLKYTLWIIFSLLSSLTFIGYFTSIRELLDSFYHLTLSQTETGCILFFTILIYATAGSWREQFCVYICSYARFQSVMFDRDTFVISYNKSRGEPRGNKNQNILHKGEINAPNKDGSLGHCVNCFRCVSVCPVGIDIRDGFQSSCISCAACIDACNDVMDKMRYPKWLILYATEQQLEGATSKIIRPRLLAYCAALVIMICLFSYTLMKRVPLGVDIIRDRNQLYRETESGLIENIYAIKIRNMTQSVKHYEIKLKTPHFIKLKENTNIIVEPNEIYILNAQLHCDSRNLHHRSTPIFFEVMDLKNPKHIIIGKSRFISPAFTE